MSCSRAYLLTSRGRNAPRASVFPRTKQYGVDDAPMTRPAEKFVPELRMVGVVEHRYGEALPKLATRERGQYTLT
jgi:hypothetical protein